MIQQKSIAIGKFASAAKLCSAKKICDEEEDTETEKWNPLK